LGRICLFEQQQLGAIFIVLFLFDVVFAPVFGLIRPAALIELEMITQTAPQQGAVSLWAAANFDWQ